MLKTLNVMSSEEANHSKDRVDVSTQALRAYYQLPRATQYNLNEALDVLVTLTDRSQKIVHAEQHHIWFLLQFLLNVFVVGTLVGR